MALSWGLEKNNKSCLQLNGPKDEKNHQKWKYKQTELKIQFLTVNKSIKECSESLRGLSRTPEDLQSMQCTGLVGSRPEIQPGCSLSSTLRLMLSHSLWNRKVMSTCFPFFCVHIVKQLQQTTNYIMRGRSRNENTTSSLIGDTRVPAHSCTLTKALIWTDTKADVRTHIHKHTRTHTHTPTCTHVRVRLLHTLCPHEQTSLPPNTDASRRGCKHIWRSVAPKTKGEKRTNVANVQPCCRLAETSAVLEFHHSCAAHLCNQLRIAITEQGQQVKIFLVAFQVDNILIHNNNSHSSMKTHRLTDTAQKPKSKKRQRRGRVAWWWNNDFAFTFSKWRRHREDPTVDDLQTDYCLSYTD